MKVILSECELVTIYMNARTKFHSWEMLLV